MGNFYDPRLDDATQFPVAARARLGHIHSDTNGLPISFRRCNSTSSIWRLPLPLPAHSTPLRPLGDRCSSTVLCKCATCHTPPALCRARLESACRGRDRYRRLSGQSFAHPSIPHHAPPRDRKPREGGLLSRWPVRALPDVIDHYDTVLTLGLGAQDKTDLVEFVKSL